MVFAFSAPAAAERSILVFGDSLSAAYGISQARGWVALLAERLKRERLDYIVVNASISGEISSGGAARLAAALDKHRPAVVVLQLGANDGLRGLPAAQLRQNLNAMVQQSKKAGARVLVLGVKIPPNYGPDYSRQFENAFAAVAKQQQVRLVPFFIEDVVDNAEHFLPDRIHPAESAQPFILERVWKSLRPLLK
ncbi:MAG TPA: arylesterase [Burkholderiales bacterium]